MSASIWLWQFMRPVTPEQAAAAAARAKLSDAWVPEVPFAEVATRAVGKTKAKRTTEPGLILWTATNGARWYADLVEQRMDFEKPRSNAAKTITGRLEAARHLQPADLASYMTTMIRGWGAVQLLGANMWIVPNMEGADAVLTMLRSMPGAAVAAIPIQDSTVAAEVLALLAGRLQAESEYLQAGVDDLKPESIRRRAAGLRSRAEDVAKLADLYETDMTALGGPLLEAEAKVLAKLPGRRYPAPLDFTGGLSHQDPDPSPQQQPQVPPRRRRAAAPQEPAIRQQAVVTYGEIPPGGDPTDGRTISRIGDPQSAPVPRVIQEVETE